MFSKKSSIFVFAGKKFELPELKLAKYGNIQALPVNYL